MKQNPPQKYVETAEYRERFIKKLLNAFQTFPHQPRTQIINNFLCHDTDEDEIFLFVGHVSRSTLYGWLRDYREGGVKALIPRYANGTPKISKPEKMTLSYIIQDGIKIGTAIVIMKYLLKRRGTPSPSSAATLRRWAKRYLKKVEGDK